MGSRLAGLHMKGTVIGESFIHSRNWLALGGKISPPNEQGPLPCQRIKHARFISRVQLEACACLLLDFAHAQKFADFNLYPFTITGMTWITVSLSSVNLSCESSNMRVVSGTPDMAARTIRWKGGGVLYNGKDQTDTTDPIAQSQQVEPPEVMFLSTPCKTKMQSH